MPIKKKLINFKKLANFDTALQEGNILSTSIVFIDDTLKIWTHGVYFSSLKEVLDKYSELSQTITDEATNGKKYVDDQIGTLDSEINVVKTDLATETSERKSKDSALESKIDTETSRAQEAEANRYTKNETYTKEEVNNLITTPNQEYVSVTATDQTTAVTDVLPAIGLADTVYRVGNWDGSQYDVTKYSEYAWNGKDYVHLSTKTGEASAASNVTYNNSDSKLDATNVQQAVDEVRKRSNYNDGDNIIDFNTIHIITDNPEFAIAAIDVNDRILYGIKADGQPYWGVGVPKVVRDYVDKQVNDILGTDNITETIDSLKEVEKFLSDFKNSDTLKALLDIKADKTDVDNTVANINADIADKYKKSNPNDEEGNVIDTNSIKSVINNPEYFKAFVDNTNKLIEAIGIDGVRKFFAGINIQGISQCVIDNPDYLIAWVDKENRIIFAIQHDGNPYFGYGVPKQIKDAINAAVGNVFFDISAYHATGGTLATYDNLEDALGTNGKNIPQSLRKGGMSVKFVQTSDNKYVQYRLRHTNWTTDVAYWVNIEEILNNLITDIKNNIATVSDGPDDFSIQDEEGNTLCLWKDGNIKTKNFDSQNVGGKAESDSDHIKFKAVDGKGYEQHEYVEKPIPTISFVTPLRYCNASDAAASYIPTTNKFAAAMIAVTSQDIVTIPYLMGIVLDTTDSAHAIQGTGDYPITLGLYDSAQKLIGVLDKTTTAQTNKVIDFRKELTLVKSSTTSTYTLTAGSTYYLYIQTQANSSSVTDSSTTDDYVNACQKQINAITIESHVLKDIRAIDANSVDIVDSSNSFDFDIEDENKNVIFGLKNGHIKTKNFDSRKILQVIDGLKKDNSLKPLEGKRGVWLGTSIPAHGYPQIVGNLLGMTIYNESVGASSCRKGKQNYSNDPLSDNYLGLYGVAWQNYFFGLSASQEEKFYIMRCWSANGRKEVLKDTINSETGKNYTDSEISSVKGFRSLMGGNFFGNLTDPDAGDSNNEPTDWFIEKFEGTKNYALSCSYNTSSVSGVLIEGKIEKYLNKDKFPDIWFFDHSHNDAYNESPEDMSKIPTNFYDRNYYIGACNFIFNLILSYKSTAKIILIGHYTKGEKGTGKPLSCYSAMKKLQDIWQFPLIESYKNLPFSSDSIIQTNGYWDSSNVWHEEGFELEQDTSVDLGSSTQQKINGFWYYRIGNVVYKSNNQASNFHSPILSPILYNGRWYQQISLKQRYFSDDLHPSSWEAKKLYAKILANEIIKQFLIPTFYE